MKGEASQALPGARPMDCAVVGAFPLYGKGA